MSQQQQPVKPATSDVKWHPVRKVTFDNPTSVPGGPARSELRGDIVQTNVKRWTIEYSPSWRHFRITHFEGDPKKEPEICMVPESGVRTWEPMP